MGLKKTKKPNRQAFRMNLIFLTLSVVMLIVMGLSIWKDTHPSWMAYQTEFRAVEQELLQEKIQVIRNKLENPTYEADFESAKDAFDNALADYDSAASELEQLEAQLDELELRATLQQTDYEDEGETAETTDDELSDLERELAGLGDEFAEDDASDEDDSDGGSDLTDLERELAGAFDEPSDEAADDEQSDDPDSDLQDLAGELEEAFPSSSEEDLDEPLVEDIAVDDGFLEESVDFDVDIEAAQLRHAEAFRELAEAEHRHERETIGLPSSEKLKLELAETRFEAAQAKLSLTESDLLLQESMASVKSSATILVWAKDDAEFARIAEDEVEAMDPERLAALHDSSEQLVQYRDGLRQELQQSETRLEKSFSAKPRIVQIVVPRLDTVERCTTCHLGIEDAIFKDAPQPFRTHSGRIMETHSPDKFACTSCHGGWGRALELDEAHGEHPGKGTPILSGDLVQASCAKCHGSDQALKGTEVFGRGEMLFKNSGCAGCHKIGSEPLEFKSGPSLDRVGEKVDHQWLIAWLRDPQSHSLDARMPNFGFSVEEAEAISAYLLTLREQQPSTAFDASPLSDLDRAKAERLFVDVGCLGCHTVQGEGGSVGPELTHVATKVSSSWLYAWIDDPKAFHPDSKMPVFGLSSDQLELLTNYLVDLEDGEIASIEPDVPFDDKVLERGKNLVEEHGCGGCHDIGGAERLIAPDLNGIGEKTVDDLEFGEAKSVKRTLHDWIRAKIDDPRQFETEGISAKMPKFGLSEDETNALAVYLLSLTNEEFPREYTLGLFESRSILARGRRVFEDRNCGSCHMLNGVGQTVGPDLTREGEKVRPKWLFEFLMNPQRIRWWQPAVMPNFHLSEEEATLLTEYLMLLSNQAAPFDFVPKEAQIFPLADIGAKRFITLKCQSCHPIAGQQLVAGGDTEQIGPDLAMAPDRLKADWLFRFMKNPQAIDPGTQMPDFQQSDEVYQSLTDFLMKQRR